MKKCNIYLLISLTVLLLLVGCQKSLEGKESVGVFKDSSSASGSIFGDKSGETGKIFGGKESETGKIFGDKQSSGLTGEAIAEIG
ncbi:TPA: hypothetical protein HA246_01865 [Candidatus Woesearchaeota archaeon]|nr:hypothetical protein [Candidatus Woesearchaeota archaeon]